MMRLPLQTRLAPLQPDPASDLIDVVFSTGAQVRRYDFWRDETVIEELDIAGADLTRLNAGAPVLDSHQACELEHVVGVVERAWIDGAAGRAQIRLSPRDDLAGLRADVAAGILRNVSVGYTIEELERIERPGEPTLVRATRWTPLELSIVPVPADPGAHLRRDGTSPDYPVHVTGATMADTDTGPDTEPAEQPDLPAEPAAEIAPPADLAEQIQRAIAAERTRIAAITDLCARHRMPERAADLIARGATLDTARDDILAAIEARDPEINTRAPAATAPRDQWAHVLRKLQFIKG